MAQFRTKRRRIHRKDAKTRRFLWIVGARFFTFDSSGVAHRKRDTFFYSRSILSGLGRKSITKNGKKKARWIVEKRFIASPISVGIGEEDAINRFSTVTRSYIRRWITASAAKTMWLHIGEIPCQARNDAAKKKRRSMNSDATIRSIKERINFAYKNLSKTANC